MHPGRRPSIATRVRRACSCPPTTRFSETGVMAEGIFNRPQWVYADVALDRLREIKASGEMRNSTDWSAQPGAAPLVQHVEVVALT